MDNEGNFHFIDDEYVSPEPLERRYIIDCLIKNIKNQKVCNEILEHFNFPPLKIKSDSESDNMEELIKKYFRLY